MIQSTKNRETMSILKKLRARGAPKPTAPISLDMTMPASEALGVSAANDQPLGYPMSEQSQTEELMPTNAYPRKKKLKNPQAY